MALRHQVASIDPVKLVNGRSSSRTFKDEYTSEHGKRLSGICSSHSEGRTSMPGSKINARCPTHESKVLLDEFKAENTCRPPPKEDGRVDRGSKDKSRNMDENVLLQWGQRKRQRNGRFESKAAAAEESSTFSKKSIKMTSRSSMTEKLPFSSLPVQHRPSRGQTPNSSQPNRETTPTNEQKSLDTCSKSGDANHVSNGYTLPFEKLQLRASASVLGQPDTVVNCNGTLSGNSLAMNAQGRAEIEATLVEPPTFENIHLDSLEWPKFVIPLSRTEKEDDFLAIKGSKLPQRPKKRAKHIEKIMHYVNPGMWLSDLTRERYEVKEKKATKKRPRGLKAMGSIDSDSE